MPEPTAGFRQTHAISDRRGTAQAGRAAFLGVSPRTRSISSTPSVCSSRSHGQRLFSHCRNFPLSILYGRDDDIPGYIGHGTVDLGIVGRNLIHEEGVAAEELVLLGFGYCSLVVATMRDAPYIEPEELLQARIAYVVSAFGATLFSRAGRRPGDRDDQRIGRSGAVVGSGGCDRRADRHRIDVASTTSSTTILERRRAGAHPQASAQSGERATSIAGQRIAARGRQSGEHYGHGRERVTRGSVCWCVSSAIPGAGEPGG